MPPPAPAGLERDAQDDDLDEYDDESDDEYDDQYDDEYDEDEHDVRAPRSTATEWLVVVAQVVAGALLGAVLWTVFSLLWGSIPILALVLAAVATAGLVFGVRALRRGDDLQTTVRAVVVGLVVTVSPAAVALLGS